MLADLSLPDLPTSVLVAIKHAINDELLKRKKEKYIQRRESFLSRSSFVEEAHYPAYDEAIDQLVSLNSSRLYSLPSQARKSNFRDRMRYLPCVLAQHWDFLFPNTDTMEKACYVYAHIDPREGRTELTSLKVVLKGAPFYIGKGSQRRAWDLKRNQGHGKIIKQIRDEGFPGDALVQIITDNLTEQESLVLEAKLIYLFGSIYDESINGCLVNLADHIKPQFYDGMHKLPSRKPYERKYPPKNA